MSQRKAREQRRREAAQHKELLLLETLIRQDERIALLEGLLQERLQTPDATDPDDWLERVHAAVA